MKLGILLFLAMAPLASQAASETATDPVRYHCRYGFGNFVDYTPATGVVKTGFDRRAFAEGPTYTVGVDPEVSVIESPMGTLLTVPSEGDKGRPYTETFTIVLPKLKLDKTFTRGEKHYAFQATVSRNWSWPGNDAEKAGYRLKSEAEEKSCYAFIE